MKRGQEQSGFDLAVSRAVAKALNKPLQIVWYESKIEKDKSPALTVNALLSGAYCDLVAGYILYRGVLGEPASAKAQLPEVDGGQRGSRNKEWVRLGAISPSKPYHFLPLTVVLGAGAGKRQVRLLSDLHGLVIGTETATLAAHLLSMYRGGMLRNALRTFAPGEEVLHALDKGEIDATLVELQRVDAYWARHPGTRIRQTGYQHSLGFNVGFVALMRSSALLAQVNKTLDALIASGALPTMAQEAGMTYVAPRSPAVLEQINPALLVGD
ncbi:MAG TPA: transporter substrate-binding domain-containing protein [Candidatus Binatia bacterium]|jgi:ABC-type amino acid transport substrate-binding protein|nr:transporter substrate-binding domain-containing protein [Candidatus Binatia bacterium]